MDTSLYFPAELLLFVANFLEVERDINSLAQTNKRFNPLSIHTFFNTIR
jgi:hypothetical protein